MSQPRTPVNLLPPTSDPTFMLRASKPGSQEPKAMAVPGYEILEELGRGGMGVVYKARDVQLDRLVALKVILNAQQATSDELQRFHLEARAVASLQHAGIIGIFQIGEVDGVPYLALEFCPGGDLAQLTWKQTFVPRRAAEILLEIAIAVGVAHSQGIIHRDLKPGNILIAADGSFRVSDFGLARCDHESNQTATGQILGTPAYMAPEQAVGQAHQVGPSADVYSLGAILYQLLTGRPPFCAPTAMETLQQVVHNDPIAPRRFSPMISADLETICLKCLRKNSARRYHDANELAGDLRAYLEGRPILARPVGTGERLVRWAIRHPALALAATMAVVGTLIILVFTAMLWRANSDLLQANAQLATTQTSLEQSLGELEKSDRRNRESLLLAAKTARTRGLALVRSSNANEGLLWLVRAAQLAPQDSPILHDLAADISATSAQLHPITGSIPQVQSAVFSPNGDVFLVNGANPRVYDTNSAKAKSDVLPKIGFLPAISCGGRFAAWSGPRGLVIHDCQKNVNVEVKPAAELVQRMTPAKAMLLGADRFVTRSQGNHTDGFCLWDCASGQRLFQHSLAVTPESPLDVLDRFAVCRTEGAMVVLDLKELKAEQRAVEGQLVLDPRGNYVAEMKRNERRIEIRTLGENKKVSQAETKMQIRSATFSPDGERLAVLEGTTSPKRGSIVSSKTGRVLKSIRLDLDKDEFFARPEHPPLFSPDGRYVTFSLTSRSENKQDWVLVEKIVEVESGQRVINVRTGHTSPELFRWVSKDLAIFGDGVKGLQMLDLRAKPMIVPIAHHSGLFAVVPSPGNNGFLTIDQERTLRLFTPTSKRNFDPQEIVGNEKGLAEVHLGELLQRAELLSGLRLAENGTVEVLENAELQRLREELERGSK